MKEDVYVEKHIEKWKSLEHYLKNLSMKSLAALPKQDIDHFTSLFSQASHHLAYARTHFPDGNTVQYLNQLIGRCHNHIYVREKQSFREKCRFLLKAFPQKIKEQKWMVLLSFFCFMAGVFVSFFLVAADSSNILFFYPEETVNNLNLEAASRDWNYPIMSSLIMTNNIRVSFLALVWGIFAGIGTCYVLFYNGLVLGALTSFVMVNGTNMVNYWALILPHGFLELTAIFISGGAGLMIGKALLIPGDMKRKDSLIKGAKEAMGLIYGVIVMLIIAGLIEGFFTPLDLNPWLKVGAGFLTFIAFIIYFLILSRDSGSPHSTPALQEGSRHS